MNAPDDAQAVVVATMRFLAGGWVHGEDDQRWLSDTADQIELSGPEHWDCCPLCAETICDGDCPLAAVRRGRSPVHWPD